MEIKEFLAFEPKKILLPAILLTLLIIVLALNSFSEPLSREVRALGDGSLDVLKLVVYNATLNGTDNIENRLVAAEKKAENSKIETFSAWAPLAASGAASQYVLNTFGANFCEVFTPTVAISQKECIGTRFGLLPLSESYRLNFCAAEFADIVQKEFYLSYDPHSFSNQLDVERAKAFIYSERGENIFNYLESCWFSVDNLTDYDSLKSDISSNSFNNMLFISGNEEVPKIRLLNATDVMLTGAIVFITGYFVSCIVIFIHRKTILYRKGRKIYLIVFGLSASMFLFIVFTFTYFDFRVAAAVSLIASYVATLTLWHIYGKSKESKIMRRMTASG